LLDGRAYLGLCALQADGSAFRSRWQRQRPHLTTGSLASHSRCPALTLVVFGEDI
jgi:hypothetical protein